MNKLIRFLLNTRMSLIFGSFILGVALIILADLFGGSLVMLETPHIEGGVETTIQNMINDHGYTMLVDKEDVPRNEWGIREDLLERGGSWLR